MLKLLVPVKDCVITSTFDSPRDYSKIAPTRKQLHEGMDFAPKNKDDEYQVSASRSGLVVKTGFDAKGYGNFVVIKHDDRYLSWYCHLKEIDTREGQHLSTGDFLGIMGTTGNSTGKHLHFTLQDLVQGLDNYVVAKVVDPQPYFVSKIDTINLSNLSYNTINLLLKG